MADAVVVTVTRTEESIRHHTGELSNANCDECAQYVKAYQVCQHPHHSQSITVTAATLCNRNMRCIGLYVQQWIDRSPSVRNV